VAANISRFDPAAPFDTSRLIAAVELAGVQDLINALPDGYNTIVGPGGLALSGGQRNRIALARAVYGWPKLLVLDEPNAYLDARAEQFLLDMIHKLRAARATVVIVTHKLATLSHCDDVLVLNGGTVQAFGARDQIITKLSRLAAKPPLTVVDGRAERRQS
jgi:ABC-type protease/lipase transport system fused ATPase/permease subunit